MNGVAPGTHWREAVDLRHLWPRFHNEAEHARPHEASQRQDGLLLHQVWTTVQVEAVFGEVKEEQNKEY